MAITPCLFQRPAESGPVTHNAGFKTQSCAKRGGHSHGQQANGPRLGDAEPRAKDKQRHSQYAAACAGQGKNNTDRQAKYHMGQHTIPLH